MGQPEKKVELAVKNYIRKEGYYCEKIHGGEYQNGISDLIACIEGRYCGFEIKAPNGHLSEIQKKKLRVVRAAGGIGEGIWSLEIVQKIIAAIRRGDAWTPLTDLTYRSRPVHRDEPESLG
jgi:hypothetical protein